MRRASSRALPKSCGWASTNVVVRVTAAGDVLVRVRASATWVALPATCLRPTADGWVMMRNAQPGEYNVYVEEADVFRPDLCPA